MAKNLVTINVNGVAITCTAEQAIAITQACGTAPKASAKQTAPKKETKKATKKSAPKKSAKKNAPTTKAEALEAKYGDLDTRKAYVALRNKVADEFKALAEETGKYIPKRSYTKVLKDTTDSLNGKFSKAKVKAAFVAKAK